MESLIKALIGAAALAFVLAVVAAIAMSGSILGVPAEAFSRASSNLALLAIAAAVCLGKRPISSAGP